MSLYIYIEIHIYIYIHIYIIIYTHALKHYKCLQCKVTRVNYDNLTASSLESWLVRGIITKMDLIQVTIVKYYNFLTVHVYKYNLYNLYKYYIETHTIYTNLDSHNTDTHEHTHTHIYLYSILCTNICCIYNICAYMHTHTHRS